MVAQKSSLYRHRTGQWLPTDHAKVRDWVDQLLKRSPSFEEHPLDPVLQDFKTFIDNDPLIRILAIEMFREVPVTPPYNKDPTKLKPQIKNYNEMFQCVNTILGEGPQWYMSDDPEAIGLIGFPISAILDWPMGTRSGYAFFTNPSVNAHWKAVLNKWKDFLQSPRSLSVLGPTAGWTSPSVIQKLAKKGNHGADNHAFHELYHCDPSAPYHGFTSWDHFFTREFRDTIRPVAHPDRAVPSVPGEVDPTSVIVHPCESTPSLRQEKVKLHDSFWLKSQAFSLAEMLNGEHQAKPFVDGQVHQAHLSALSYHRWHAPVSGTVVSTEIVPGTYFAENFYEGFAESVHDEPKPDPATPNNAHVYLAGVAARGIIHIHADNEKIGTMAMVLVGICEASSIEFFVKPGDRVTKGQCIGTFHFGGSDVVMIFQRSADLTFTDPGPYDDDSAVKLNSLLATVA